MKKITILAILSFNIFALIATPIHKDEIKSVGFKDLGVVEFAELTKVGKQLEYSKQGFLKENKYLQILDIELKDGTLFELQTGQDGGTLYLAGGQDGGT